MPTFNDLYYTFIGNKYLRPEYTTQYDLGVVYTKAFQRGALRRMEGRAEAPDIMWSVAGLTIAD